MDASGAILIDKPPFITSYDVIRELKRMLPVKRIGHTGTLDPIATGLMIVLLGAATRLAGYFLGLNKVYRFTIKLGEETDTLDSAGTVTRTCDYSGVDAGALTRAVGSLQGDLEQYPPAYSAVKYRGKPLYKYARKGERVDVAPRRVRVESLTIDEFRPPYAIMTAEVSSGTYIRSLAKSMGDMIGCYAHVASIRRLSVGSFTLSQAVQLQEIKRYLEDNAGDYRFLMGMDVLMGIIKKDGQLRSKS